MLVQQTAISYSSSLLILRILRVSYTLALRRTDGTIPEFSFTLAEENTLTITLPTQWLARHPLRAAALASELELQAKHNLVLQVQEK